MSDTYSRIIVEKDAELLKVRINRPGDRNSIDSTLMDELTRMMEAAEGSDARVIVFSGTGDTYFIGGADGVEMMQCSPESAKAFSKKIQSLFNRMESSPLILVAAIHGLCFGGGFEFALACDLRIATASSRIGLPEVKVGLIPGGGGTQRLPKLVGTGKAMEMILSGKLYSGTQAYDQGLVHHCVPDAELEAGCRKFLEPVLRNPQYALSQAKLAVKGSQNNGFSQGLQIENHAFQNCFHHDYFVKLMCRQLEEGALETSMRLPDSICRERG